MSATTAGLKFRDRRDAGRQLAAALAEFGGVEDLVILALPRGGVPVAAEVAKQLGKPLDVLVVRKLGVPGHEEVAFGAIAGGGIRVLSEDLVNLLELDPIIIEAVVEKEQEELERRERFYRKGKPMPEIEGKTVILVDDGIATGSTMSAAIRLLREMRAEEIIVAVPVAPPDTVTRLNDEADEVISLVTPGDFVAVGLWYDDFSQTGDDEVYDLLSRGAERNLASGNAGEHAVLDSIREHAMPLTGAKTDYDELLEMIGSSSVVLLGEASHGTHEFYRERAEITKRLIEEKGFTAVAVEADWPDAYQVNRYVRGESDDADAVEALSGFGRFPAWMWRNSDVLDFIGWLRDHNERVVTLPQQVGFYGLDLYSLYKSIDEVIAYLDKRNPDDAAKAREMYGCMKRYGRDPQNYGMMVVGRMGKSCREEVIRQFNDLRLKEAEYLALDGPTAADEFFFAEQNARLIMNAEEYYRKMFIGTVSSWNHRDEHMMETLISLLAHMQSSHGSAKVVVWAHNSHLGDARATEMTTRGELNLGQLVRETFSSNCRSIGFTTSNGTVTAASGWHLDPEMKEVRPALEGSYEKLFHQAGIPRFWLDLTKSNPAVAALREPRLERAIGVVYLPENERRSHYFMADIGKQFDGILHFDQTRAVEPLEKHASWSKDELPETYPVGL